MKQALFVGIDLVDVDRINALFLKHDTATLSYLFTAEELAYCKNNVLYYALSFSAKESVGKALGTGLAGLNWFDIQAIPQPDQTIRTQLTGNALNVAAERSISSWVGFWAVITKRISVTTVVGRC
jgi:holo-[acyl-carrier protein] synthase